MHRIHIVGFSPRTGTTLLAECMAACFEIDAFEPHEAGIDRDRPGAHIYLTKNPGDTAKVPTALQRRPELYVFCMMRDPRDVIVSRHAGNPDRYWAPLRYWKLRLEQLGPVLAHPRFAVVRYEDLVTKPDAVQDAIIARCPFLKKRAPFSVFDQIARPSAQSLQALGGLRCIEAASIGNWRNHLPRVAGQLLLHGPISDELIRFGYEADEAWLAELDGVTPDLAPSHWPEFRDPAPASKAAAGGDR